MAQPSLDKPKTQLLGNGCETAKHHLNPSAGTAENTTFGGSKTAPLEPPKKKKRAPVHRPKTWRNLAWTIAKMQLLGNGCETAKHHLNPSAGTAENTTFGGSKTAPLEPPKKKKRAPVHRPKTWRNVAWTSRKRSSSARDAKQPNTT